MEAISELIFQNEKLRNTKILINTDLKKLSIKSLYLNFQKSSIRENLPLWRVKKCLELVQVLGFKETFLEIIPLYLSL